MSAASGGSTSALVLLRWGLDSQRTVDTADMRADWLVLQMEGDQGQQKALRQVWIVQQYCNRWVGCTPARQAAPLTA